MSDRQAYISLTIIISITLAFSLLGIMFGHHWDENRIMDSARESFQTGNLLPGWYVYPSVPHDLATLVQFTKHLSFIYPGFEEPWKQHLCVRGVFILYSTAGIVFTFLLTRIITKSNFYALIGAAFLAFSWEFGYHIRWIAPDSIMMTNVMACVYFCLRYYQKPTIRSFMAAGIFGGLATGCKYPAGLVALPLLIATYYGVKAKVLDRKYFWKHLIQRWLLIGLIAAFTFILTTPGFILDFSKLWQDLYEHITIYQNSHANYQFNPLSNPPFDHFLVLLEYFSLAVFSYQPVLSLLAALLVLPGIYALTKVQKPVIIITMAFPIIYLGFFCFQHLMIARNYQVILPFLFLLSSLGIQFLINISKNTYIKTFVLSVTFIVIGFNIYFGFKAGLSIYHYTEEKIYTTLKTHLKEKPNQTFYLTKELKADYKEKGFDLNANVIADKALPDTGEFKVVTYLPREHSPHWPRYSHNFVDKVIGQQEVNVNYYPTWNGYPKILIVDSEKFKTYKQNIQQ